MAKRKKNVVAPRSSARLNPKSDCVNSALVGEDTSSPYPLEVDEASSNSIDKDEASSSSSIDCRRAYEQICAKNASGLVDSAKSTPSLDHPLCLKAPNCPSSHSMDEFPPLSAENVGKKKVSPSHGLQAFSSPNATSSQPVASSHGGGPAAQNENGAHIAYQARPGHLLHHGAKFNPNNPHGISNHAGPFVHSQPTNPHISTKPTYGATTPTFNKWSNGLNQPAPISTSNWKELFLGKIKDSLKLEYFEPEIIDGQPVACPPVEVFEEAEKYWQTCLIGQFIDKPPPFFLIKRMVDVHWKQFAKVEIKPADFRMLVFRFDNQEVCKRVLDQLWHGL